jgi:hypothetical protein
VRLDWVRESVQQVAHADDYVVFYHRVHVGFGQDRKESGHLLLAVFLADAHKLTVRQHRSPLQLRATASIPHNMLYNPEPLSHKRILHNGIRQRLQLLNPLLKLPLNPTHNLIQLLIALMLICLLPQLLELHLEAIQMDQQLEAAVG